MNPVVAVCIRTFSGKYKGKAYNRLPFLKRNMTSLVANTKIPHNVTVIDDVSTLPEQHEYLHRIAKQGVIDHLRIKASHKGRQHSFALQRYLGYKTGAPYIYICDDDYEYQQGWLTELVESYEVLKKHYADEGKQVGVLSGFNRKGRKYVEKFKVGGKTFGTVARWIGCRWLMSREVLEKGGWDQLAPTPNFPPNWTSPWIDDGSYQLALTSKFGFADAVVRLTRPSLIEHIGTIGVHAKPSKYIEGVK